MRPTLPLAPLRLRPIAVLCAVSVAQGYARSPSQRLAPSSPYVRCRRLPGFWPTVPGQVATVAGLFPLLRCSSVHLITDSLLRPCLREPWRRRGAVSPRHSARRWRTGIISNPGVRFALESGSKHAMAGRPLDYCSLRPGNATALLICPAPLLVIRFAHAPRPLASARPPAAASPPLPSPLRYPAGPTSR